MNSVFVYDFFAPVDSMCSRRKQSAINLLENVLSLAHCFATTRSHIFHAQYMRYRNNPCASQGGETPPGPYDDDDDDDDDGSK